MKPAVMRSRKGVALALLLLLALATLLWQLPWAESVRFAQGVELLSAHVAEQADDAHPLRVRLRLRAEGPLDQDVLVLLHWSGDTLACNGFAQSEPGTPASRWRAGEVQIHEVALPVPERCGLGDLDLFASLYLKRDGAPLSVLAPHVEHERVLLGTSEVVVAQARAGEHGREGRALARAALFAPIAPWCSWLLGLGAALLLALVVRVGVLPFPEREPAPAPALPAFAARLSVLLRVLPIALFLAGIALVLEFFKDDAFISLRYARNLSQGLGLVFNPGERVEGISNFLWTLVLAPFALSGLDPLRVCEWLGAALGIGCLLLVTRLSSLLQEDRSRFAAASWAACWLASSSSFTLYAHSGLEQPLAALLPCAGAVVLYRSRAALDTAPESARRGYLRAGLLLSAACLTRPELHLTALLVMLPAFVDVLRARRVRRAEWQLVLGVLALTLPAHLFRFFYYGSLLPNTFYVKASSDGAVWRTGLDTLRELFAFNHTGLLLLLAPLAFLARRRALEKLSCLSIALAFLIYYARVGVDEMVWHRLYIPALPFLAALAASGGENLLRLIAHALRFGQRARHGLALSAWLGLSYWVYDNLQLSYEAWQGFNGYGTLAGSHHPDLGKYLTRHERAGGLVAFQDMGATPYYAPDLRFFDFVGLVDTTVAHARYAHGLHTYIQDDSSAQRAFDAEMRDYFFARDPQWTILTVYADGAQRTQVAEAFAKDPSGAALAPYQSANRLQFDLFRDPRFQQRYVPVRTWQRSSAYYLSLFRRRDLFAQTPRELVLERAPAQLRGARAEFAGGLTLLGAELTHTTRERHEAFVTTWWRLPGPLPHDLMFELTFVRTRGKREITTRHVPGDWLYPADRWQTGQILEDRTLFQLPTQGMRRGEYKVYVSVVRRADGSRLVLEGESHAQRVLLGTLKVEAFHSLFDALIPRTDVATMRAHAERIVR
jgi:arabinofuranosyltransferase